MNRNIWIVWVVKVLCDFFLPQWKAKILTIDEEEEEEEDDYVKLIFTQGLRSQRSFSEWLATYPLDE
jgi:hypothetical protein